MCYMLLYIPNGIDNVAIKVSKVERTGITKERVVRNNLVTDGDLTLQLDPMNQTDGYD